MELFLENFNHKIESSTTMTSFYKLYFVSLQSVLQQATTLMAGDSKEKNDEGKKNLLLTTLQVGLNFNSLSHIKKRFSMYDF